jgi:hypothetical protein
VTALVSPAAIANGCVGSVVVVGARDAKVSVVAGGGISAGVPVAPSLPSIADDGGDGGGAAGGGGGGVPPSTTTTTSPAPITSANRSGQGGQGGTKGGHCVQHQL